MKRVLIGINFLFLIGCGQYDPRPFTNTHKDMIPFINYFTQLTSVQVDIPINYGNTGEKLGVCSVNGQYKWITINEKWFKSHSDEDKLVLVLHELGHCVLNKPHVDGYMRDGCALSIMNTYHIGSYCFLLHEEFYLEDYLYGF